MNMIIDETLLNTISLQAQLSPRLRMNYNLHDSLDAKAQRLLNALEPGTQIPIHRHIDTAETYVLLRGKIRVMQYDDNGVEENTDVLDPLVGNYGIHIPAGQYHSLEVVAVGSVILEVKEGPYKPITEEELLR